MRATKRAIKSATTPAGKVDQFAEQTSIVRELRTQPSAEGRAGFEALLLGQLPALMGRARSLENSDAAAQDLVQDTIERALIHRDSFELGTSLSGWLMQIM